jgi:hypothetical protein
MGYDLVVDAHGIQTNGEHVDDIDHLWLGQPFEMWYTVENVGDEPAPDHYDFLSITDNALGVEYEDWAPREGFAEQTVERTFNVPIPLAAGIHWVFVTVDAGQGTTPASARVVVVATDEAERMRLLRELRGNGSEPDTGVVT